MVAIREAQAPEAEVLWTAGDAIKAMPYLNHKTLWAAAGAGMLSAFKSSRGGYVLYRRGELEWLAGELAAGKSLPQIHSEWLGEQHRTTALTTVLKGPYALRLRMPIAA